MALNDWGHTSHITLEHLDEYYTAYPSEAPRKWRIEHGFEEPENPAPLSKAKPPAIPAGYLPGEPSGALGLQGGKGILANGGASGVLISGGSDVKRGRIAAELLMGVYALNEGLRGSFVDYPDLLDRCRASPLYGEESRSVVVVEYKKKDILTLHAIDVAITDRYGSDVLEELLRSRNARRQKTILTTRMLWQEFDRRAMGKPELIEYIENCIAVPGTNKLNILALD